MMTKREVYRMTQFRRDLRKAHRQDKDIALLDKIATFRPHRIKMLTVALQSCYLCEQLFP